MSLPLYKVTQVSTAANTALQQFDVMLISSPFLQSKADSGFYA